MSGGSHRLTEPGKVRLETRLGQSAQSVILSGMTVRSGLTLPLLVLGVLANHHHASLALDDLAFVANALHTGSYLHFCSLP